jgi:hypothetical protein
MRFSKREQIILDFMMASPTTEFPLDDLTEYVTKRMNKEPKNFRQSLLVSIHKLKNKLSVYGIDLVNVSPLGRGNKATYKISARIATLVY